MKKYFIKTIFSGWSEVPKENFDRFVERIMNGATGIEASKKDAFIKTVTRIVE